MIADVAYGALADAGLGVDDVDGFCYAGMHQGINIASMADHLGLRGVRFFDSTDVGGASPISQIGHAAMAIATGQCRVALVAMGGLPRSAPYSFRNAVPQAAFETVYELSQVSGYALAARRHMYEYGTTSAQLAQIRVAAAYHAQFNPNALYREPVTVDDVLDSPLISDPLHRLDCCVTTDGGGAVVIAAPEVARGLGRRGVRVLGHGESLRVPGGGPVDLTITGAAASGPRALDAAGVSISDIGYASIYDSFTITVLLTLEDLGLCERGRAGRLIEEGALLAPHGRLPINTDGGGLCNNHPDRRGGMARTIEAVRQLREEAAPEVQVPDCELALVQGQGHSLGTRSAAATLILGREDATTNGRPA